MTADDFIRLADADRRQVERSILALLTSYCDLAKAQVYAALRVGSDTFAAVSDVILGNHGLRLPGLPGPLAHLLAAGEAAGYRRTVLMIPSGDGPSLAEEFSPAPYVPGFPAAKDNPRARANDDKNALLLLLALYCHQSQAGEDTAGTVAGIVALRGGGGGAGTSPATPRIPTASPGRVAAWVMTSRQYAGRMAQGIQRAITSRLLQLEQLGMGRAQDLIRAMLQRAGYVALGSRGPYVLESVAATWATQAFAAGMDRGWRRPEARAALTGFRYVSVLDSRTSDICNAYDGVQLPPEHPWWLEHSAPNHWHCRGMRRPLFGFFRVTAEPPYFPPPAPGFGRSFGGGALSGVA